MTQTAIKIKSLSKSFYTSQNTLRFLMDRFLPSRFQNKKDKVQVFEDINFEIKKGSFVGLIGPNGSGKTTLLRLIAGVYPPSNGKIQVNGKIVPFLELGVGFKPDLNAIDNIFLNGVILGMSRSFLKTKIEEILEFGGVKDFAHQQIKHFSSGMRIRLAFSIAVQSKADIYLLDEIMAVGDAKFKEKSLNKMKSLLSQNCTVVMTSHSENQIIENCEKVIYLNEGKIQFFGDVEKGIDLYRKDLEKNGV
ncbi:ATP-binding cassette domain-containing protein [Candidatus Dojkabacteria bacterium]|nr:ATP-binding cassette domain-containing protein [Candidatus Dojkabacteria bacterium]